MSYQLVTVAKQDLVDLLREVEKLKLPCGSDPESPQAIRNGAYAGIALRLYELAHFCPNAAVNGKFECEWRTIETAPTDGRKVLICRSGAVEATVGYFKIDSTGTHREYFWFDGNGAMRDPTHWMPLPKPPITNRSRL